MSSADLTEEWLMQFKAKTELKWANRKINSTIYGFQIQENTKWLPGLTEESIDSYELELGVKFHSDFRLFLTCFNGFDRPGLNVYASSGYPLKEDVLFYRYPDDISIIRARIADLHGDRDKMLNNLQEDSGLHLVAPINFVPIFQHRYILCPPNEPIICSIVATNAIVYGNSLKSYLETEFLT